MKAKTRTFLVWAGLGAAVAILVAAIMIGREFDKFSYVDKTVETQLVAPAE